ncbi:MAG TPA: chloramphenicol acetyltransferase [Dyadobacter sp.]|jgi:chloramphenicol O-acetyltransferase type A|nr:chloramphenicol acetyltransferase [Dyadobacter sp.]
MKLLDLDNWPRKEHFNFFSQFDEPFFGVCVEIDCTIAYRQAKQNNHSFFLHYLHKSLTAVNMIEPFRYRINTEKQIVVHDVVSASATINRDNGTFAFSYMPFNPDFAVFKDDCNQEIERIRQAPSIFPDHIADDIIHYSSLPWLKFTSMSHARNFAFPDSVPKISFGKMTTEGEIRTMPVSIHVHHALMDGIHVGQYVDTFQKLMNVES